MAQPITWRNVDAPSFGEASRMMSQAQVGINSGFGSLQDILKKEQATADANWQVQRDNNTQAFLDSINQYRTAEEFQAALTSGALDVGQYGGQIDRAAARAALDGRLSILQDRTTKANQFADQAAERDARPIVDRLSTMALSEDKDVRRSAKEALGIYASNGMVPKAAEIAGKLDQSDRMFVERGQADTEFVRKGEKHSSDLLSAAADRQYKSALASNARSAGSSATSTLKKELAASKAQNAAADLLIKNSPLDAGTMDTYAGQKAFEEGLSKLGLKPEQVKSIRESYAKEFKNGVLVGYDEKNEEVRIGLPVSTALAGARDSADNWYTPNFLNVSNQGKSAVKNLKEQIGSPTYVNSLQQALQAQGMRYRPLNQPANTQFTKQSPSADGAALVNRAIESRKAKAAANMTPEELQIARTTGVVPYRVQRILLEEDEEQ